MRCDCYFDPQVTLCCSINGHYDIVYPRTYPVSAAVCQCEYSSLIGGSQHSTDRPAVCVHVFLMLCVCSALFYELLYTQVFGFEEAELCQAMEAFRVGGRRYRNSPSVCSDVDFGYETPEDRCHRYARTHKGVITQLGAKRKSCKTLKQF